MIKNALFGKRTYNFNIKDNDNWIKKYSFIIYFLLSNLGISLKKSISSPIIILINNLN